MACDCCQGSGVVSGLGGMESDCKSCRFKRRALNIIRNGVVSIRNWTIYVFKHHAVFLSMLCFVTIAIPLLWHDYTNITPLLAPFGLIFVALKYQLDQVTYQKSLFPERYEIFLAVDNILSKCFHDSIREGDSIYTQEIMMQLNSIYRKSFFLFGQRTYKFMSDFRMAVFNHIYANGEHREAFNFLKNLVDEQKLSRKFTELKIDAY